MINLNNINFTKKKEKNKHLTKEMYEKIESEYNHWIAAKEAGSKKTKFMKQLASSIGTTLSKNTIRI